MSIEDINGQLADLIGKPLLVVEEEINPNDAEDRSATSESYTWTFYRFATENGWVVVRWFGSSNGYYSERVSFLVGE